MQRLFLAGPVVDRVFYRVEHARWLENGDPFQKAFLPALYFHLSTLASEVAFGPSEEPFLPVREKELEGLEPTAFLAEMVRRLRQSTHVVVVITRDSGASAVEATLAAFLGLPTMYVAESPEAIPRALLGLSTTSAIVRFSRLDELRPSLKALFAMSARARVW